MILWYIFSLQIRLYQQTKLKNPNLSFSPLPTDKIEETKFILLIYLNLQTNLKSPQLNKKTKVKSQPYWVGP